MDLYEFMDEHKEHAIAKWAKNLGVSTSGYYDWKHEREKRQKKEADMREKVIYYFTNEGEGAYGAERICGCMRRDGHSASFRVVKRIMDQEGLKSSHCIRRQRSLTDSKDARSNEFKNLTLDLDINTPFQVLSSDITYIRTPEGFDYLCQVQDVKTNIVLGCRQSSTMNADLVMETIKAAKRKWNLPEGIIFHNDRGSQYTAKRVMKQISRYGWRQSFSRVGKPGDNAWSESFFANLKKENIHGRSFKTREDARQSNFEYIELFYNRRRAQKRLGYLSPIDYLNSWQISRMSVVA